MAIEIVVLHQALTRELSEFAELLQRELEEDSEMAKARENNYRLLQLVLERPELQPREYDKMLYDLYGIDRSLDVHHQLRLNNLYLSEGRQRLGRIMKEISTKAYNLLTGNSVDIASEFDDIARIVRSKFFYERRVEGKSFLIALTLLPSWKNTNQSSDLRSLLDTLESVGKKGSYKLCRETVRRLVDVLGAEYGIEKRKTSTERVQDILEDVAVTRDVEDMRATLLIVQRESQHLKEQFEKELNNRNQEFIRNFFVRLNSVRHGELLDSIAQTDTLIQKLQKQGWKMEPELQAVPMIIQVFVNFLRNEGIVPIETIGEVRELRGWQLANYEFLGTITPKPEDQIKVMIKTPGWRLGDTVISRPRVEEISA
jgi:hypothetical protein